MEMMTPTDIGGDEDLARRILVRARSIAPCIDFFPDESEDKKNAIAILKGVIAELPEPGSRRMKSLSRNGTSMTLTDLDTVFDRDAAESLRSLCSQASAVGAPRGSFPIKSALSNVWPEGEYS